MSRPPNNALQRTRVRPAGGRSPLSFETLGGTYKLSSLVAECLLIGLLVLHGGVAAAQSKGAEAPRARTATPSGCDATLGSFWPRSAGPVPGFLALGTIIDIDPDSECRPSNACVPGVLTRFRTDELFGKFDGLDEVPTEIFLALGPIFIGHDEHRPKTCDQILVAIVLDDAPTSWVCGRLLSCESKPKKTWRAWKVFRPTKPYSS